MRGHLFLAALPGATAGRSGFQFRAGIDGRSDVVGNYWTATGMAPLNAIRDTVTAFDAHGEAFRYTPGVGVHTPSRCCPIRMAVLRRARDRSRS